MKVENLSQFIFNCFYLLPVHIYYLERFDAIAVVEYKEKTMTVFDVFTDRAYLLNDILGVLANEDTEYACLGFTPLNTENYVIRESQEEDNHLFVLSGKENVFEENKVIFPLLSRA